MKRKAKSTPQYETNAQYFKRVVDELDCSTLEKCVKEFFKLLDDTETTDNDRVFHPTEIIIGEKENYIGSCRVLHSAKLAKILPAMREFVK
jgi:hypothetical protein